MARFFQAGVVGIALALALGALISCQQPAATGGAAQAAGAR